MICLMDWVATLSILTDDGKIMKQIVSDECWKKIQMDLDML